MGTGGVEFQTPYIGSHWNDEYSSSYGANQCQTKHFEHSDYGGASTNWQTNTDSLGAMNDATTSLKWH